MQAEDRDMQILEKLWGTATILSLPTASITEIMQHFAVIQPIVMLWQCVCCRLEN